MAHQDTMLGSLQSQVGSLTRSLDDGMTRNALRLDALWDLTAHGFAEECKLLSNANQTLGALERLIANPLATQASELFRRGKHALESGWLPEAETDLRRAIDIDPYQGLIHFALGLCLGQQARTEESALAFESAIRYSLRDARALAAQSIIMAAEAWAEAGHPDRQRKVLVENAARFKDCPELQIATAAATNDDSYLTQALWLAPEMAGAVARSGASLESVASILAADSDGRLSAFLKLQAVLDRTPELPGVPRDAKGARAGLIYFGDFQSMRRADLESRLIELERTSESLNRVSRTHVEAPDAPRRESKPVTLIFLLLSLAVCLGLLIALLSPNKGAEATGWTWLLAMFAGGPAFIAAVILVPRWTAGARRRARVNRNNRALYAENRDTYRQRQEAQAAAVSWLDKHAELIAACSDARRCLVAMDRAPARLYLNGRTGATRR